MILSLFKNVLFFGLSSVLFVFSLNAQNCDEVPIDECNLVANGGPHYNQSPGFWEDDMDLLGICNWENGYYLNTGGVPTQSTPSYCVGQNNTGAITLGDWIESVVNTESITLFPGITYELSYEFFQSTNGVTYPFDNEFTISIDGTNLDQLINHPMNATEDYMSNCHENDIWETRTVTLTPTNLITGNLEILYTRTPWDIEDL